MLAQALLAWYGRAGRDLPWRETRDPYRIWLSEIMLQQTGVETVKPYYARFLDHFPTVHELAAAPLEAVIDLWAGLGYYSRARNLHAAARQLAAQHDGKFPQTVEQLTALPGIGRSTAGAILALAFDRSAPILDGNVRRVLCRLYALEENPHTPAAQRQLWAWAAELTPAERAHDYTQAIMDLGATVCTPRNPRCGDCPWYDPCRAQALGLQAELPRKAAPKAVPTRRQLALVVTRSGRILVRRRPATGMLGGLWEFPTVAVEGGRVAAALRQLQRELGLAGATELLGGVRHAYSHFKLELDLYHLSIAADRVAEAGDGHWLTPAQLSTLSLHGAHKKALPLLPEMTHR